MKRITVGYSGGNYGTKEYAMLFDHLITVNEFIEAMPKCYLDTSGKIYLVNAFNNNRIHLADYSRGECTKTDKCDEVGSRVIALMLASGDWGIVNYYCYIY